MSRHKIMIHPTPSLSLRKRQPLLRSTLSSSTSDVSSYSYSSNYSSFAEVAGGTTAECAAVCCCCPCGLANLLFLTIYKLPAGLCRRVLRRKRREQLLKKGLLLPRSRRCKCGCDDTELHIHPMSVYHKSDEEDEAEKEKGRKEMVKLEKVMWETFYGTGFWRSPSQREPPPSTPAKRSNSSKREPPKAIDKVTPSLL